MQVPHFKTNIQPNTNAKDLVNGKGYVGQCLSYNIEVNRTNRIFIEY